jgi:UDP-N-acetylmuramate dehydrogenase
MLSMMKFSEPMSKYTTFKIGGPADIWAQPEDLESLDNIMNFCRQDGIGVFIAGNGSNLLVKDAGIRGCVLNLNAEYFKDIKIEDATVTAGAGLGVSRLLNILYNRSIGGLEFLVGIPASIGGALAMNAGWQAKGQKKTQIGEFIEEAMVMNEKGKVFDLPGSEIVFRYRGSTLDKYIILRAKLRLERMDKEKISKKTMEFLVDKKAKQVLDKPSAGCIFKNPPGDSAGRLIDISGLKDTRVGDALVSTRHANFIINAGKARCSDVLKLMDIIQKKVKKDHGILLEPEIKILG